MLGIINDLGFDTRPGRQVAGQSLHPLAVGPERFVARAALEQGKHRFSEWTATLDDLQERLDPDVFWRVHRSHLVNINKIKEIVPWFSRNYILRMKDPKGTEIPVSRSQTKRLREYLKL